MWFDITLVAVVSAIALALHIVLYVLIRRWMDRDLALSFADENDAASRDYMLAQLAQAKREGIKRRDLPAWLEAAAQADHTQVLSRTDARG